MHTRSADYRNDRQRRLVRDEFAMSSRLAACPELRTYGVMVAEAEAAT
jgi:hypothetical protein